MPKQRQKVKHSPNHLWRWAIVGFCVCAGLGFFITSKISGSKTSPDHAPAAVGTFKEERRKSEDTAIFSQYAGSESCRECHESTFQLFEKSHHALAERAVDPKLDKKFFEPGQKIAHGTQTSEARCTADQLFLKTAGIDVAQKDFPLQRVIGVAPLQQFLVPADGGRFQVTELAADPHKGDWFDIFGNEDRKPGEWGHWTGRGMTWNNMCASCHNTRVRKNYDLETDTYHTSMAEMTVSCEACHGPMKAHVDWQKPRPQPATNDPTIVRFSRDQIRDTCATCHSRRAELTGNFAPGDDYFDHHTLTIPDDTDIYYPDGQVRDEDYEFASFLGSKMHHAGVRCIDCHNPHSGKTKLSGNALCMQCHAAPIPPAPKIDPVAHSFHPVGKGGSQCVDCHMPLTTYMQRHARRDHGFTIPDPLLTKTYGIPNACNRCHTDKTTGWALEFVEKWYGKRMDRFTRKRAEVIAESRTEKSDSAKLLSLLQEEKHPHWRAVEVGLLRRWADEPRVLASILAHTENTNALVRGMAVRALDPLASQPTPTVQTALKKLTDDPIRSVRIEAAWGLHSSIDTNSTAGRDLLHYLLNNADQPAGALQLGSFYFDRGDNQNALLHFQRAAKWDPNSGAFRHALAVALSSVGQNAEAIQEMKEACRLEPRNPEYQFKLGLAYNETGNLKETVQSLKKAVELDPQYSQAWYNLGLGYSALNQPELALESLSQAEMITPTNARYIYARATVLARLGRKDEAKYAAERALQLDPAFADAAELVQALSR